jgi:hypothetical protein
MYTVQSHYRGQQAYRASLVTRGNNKVDDLFVLRDTLLCYSSLDMEPLYFRKGAREGKRYTVDEVFYNYAGGRTNLRQHRLHNDSSNTWENHSYTYCVYDMLTSSCGHVLSILKDGRTGMMLTFRLPMETTLRLLKSVTLARLMSMQITPEIPLLEAGLYGKG